MNRQRLFYGPILLTREKNLFYDLKSRKPANFKKFEGYALNNGYSIIDPSLYSIEQVVNMLEGVLNIISYHSGALTHLIFCFKVSNVIELYSECYDDCFRNICIASIFDCNSNFFPMILKFDFRGVIFRIVTTGKLTLKEQVWEISEENLEKILNVNY